MINSENLSPSERVFLMALRSLLLRGVDMVELRLQIGKHGKPKQVPHSPTETIANGSAVTAHQDSDLVNLP